MLYPLKFKASYKEKIWGGKKMYTVLHKEDCREMENCGESWELSGFDEEPSVVTNGFLAGNTLNELVEVYMGDLVGEKVFRRYGQVFPLLIKFIDAQDDLSVQVHPNDDMARELGDFNGKTEMWHVIQADEGARINVGFNRRMDRTSLKRAVDENRVEEILHFNEARAGSTFFIPAGKVHAIGKGILLAEIQQLSDITYRLYDYNRTDAAGNKRELHIEEALDCIDYTDAGNEAVDYTPQLNRTVPLVSCPYFITNYLAFDKPVEKIYVSIDSFVLYVCVEGKAVVCTDDGAAETLSMGECLLLPAGMEEVIVKPEGNCSLLEVYMP